MNNNELCYKLNIPFLQDMVKDDWKHNLNWETRREIPKVITPEDSIKEEYLNFNNINWDTIVSFPLDPGSDPQIHSDNYSNTIDDTLENPDIILFGINFVVFGSCRMDYYLPSQLSKDYVVANDPNYPQRNWTTTQEPYKSYEMEPGAYLINITVPHKATAYTDRLLFSLRPRLTPHKYFEYWQSKSWNDIVKLFENHIV
jgi:hypothetical protein